MFGGLVCVMCWFVVGVVLWWYRFGYCGGFVVDFVGVVSCGLLWCGVFLVMGLVVVGCVGFVG